MFSLNCFHYNNPCPIESRWYQYISIFRHNPFNVVIKRTLPYSVSRFFCDHYFKRTYNIRYRRGRCLHRPIKRNQHMNMIWHYYVFINRNTVVFLAYASYIFVANLSRIGQHVLYVIAWDDVGIVPYRSDSG